MEKESQELWGIITVGFILFLTIIGVGLTIINTTKGDYQDLKTDYRHLDGKITELNGKVAENGSAIAFLTSTVGDLDRRVINLESSLESKMDMVIELLTQGMNIVSPSPAEPAPKE